MSTHGWKGGLRIPAAALAVGVGLCLASGPTAAQEFRGEVVDEAGNALHEVAVGLFGADRTMVAHAVSARDGTFSVVAPFAGAFTLHFTRSGYRSVSGGPYDLDPAEAVEAVVVMHRAPTVLPGLEADVEGRSRRLRIAGFYERRAEGFGRFIDRVEIERRGTVRMVDLLDPLPSLSVGRGFGSAGPGQVQNPPIWFDRDGRRCVPSLWIDGMLVRTGGSMADPLRPDDFIWPFDAEGIEFYGGPSETPIEFSRSAGCAVLVVWTREPGSGVYPQP